MASLVNNPPWSLPEPHDMPEVELADASLTSVEGALAAAREAADQIRALAPTRRPMTCACRRPNCS